MRAGWLVQLFSTCQHDFTKLSSTLGLYFQIRDDYANLCSQEVRVTSLGDKGKRVGGKVSFICLIPRPPIF